jgi:hypothetical protein
MKITVSDGPSTINKRTVIGFGVGSVAVGSCHTLRCLESASRARHRHCTRISRDDQLQN